MTGRNERWEMDTRGRLLRLLCGGNRTSRELAAELGISANGVRDHLRKLESEGLVAYEVVRRGVGKPAHEYRLTPEGSRHLSRGYLPLLSGLLSAVLDRWGAEDGELVLRDAGRALARASPPATGTVRQRVDAAAGLLGALGAGCSTVAEEGAFRIQGRCCPLRAIVPDHPLVCKAVEAMLEELTGVPVREDCERHDPPACRFLVGAAAA